MTNKVIKCPECNSSKVSIFYHHEYTHFYCQNLKRENSCNSLGKYCFKSYHHSDKRYPKIIRKDVWIEGGKQEESIEYIPKIMLMENKKSSKITKKKTIQKKLM